MAQVYSIQPRRAALWMGIESALGTAASTTRVHPIEGSIEMKLEQSELENPELRPRVADYLAPVLGQKSGTFKVSFWLRPDATQLSATTTATTPYLGIPLRSALGGEFPVSGTTNSGLTMNASAGSAASPALTAGHGARAAKGAVAMFPVSSVLEPAYITNIATDTLTVVPALSGTPTNNGAAPMAYSYYWTEAAPPSVTIELALADDSSQQWRLLGCMCTGLEIETTRDQLIKLTFSYAVADWSGPSSLSLSVTQTANPMAAPMPMATTQLILQAAATTTYPSAFYDAPEFKVSFDLGTSYAYTLGGGGVQGKAAIQRTGGRPVAKASVTAYPDISAGATVPDATWWTSRTVLQAQLRAFAGSGTSRRACGVMLPSPIVVGKPNPSLGIDADQKYMFELRTQLSSITTSPSTDQAYSPVVVFLG